MKTCLDCGKHISPRSTRCNQCSTAHRHPHIDRTPKPLTGNRQHGTYVAYTLEGCRCWPCVEATSEYERNRHRRHAYGKWGDDWTDATPIREHIDQLRSAGMGLKTIATRSGVSHGALTKLVYGMTGREPSKRVSTHTANAILAIQPSIDNLADRAHMPIHGATLRIQALVALGWSQRKLATRLGIEPRNFTDLVHGRRRISVAKHRQIVVLYDELSMRLPPQDNKLDRAAATRARNYAKAQGWLPPLALDDDTLDTVPADIHSVLEGPDAGDELDEQAVFRRMHGDPVEVTRAERLEVVRRLHADELQDTQIARIAHMDPRQVLRDRHDLGLPAHNTRAAIVPETRRRERSA